MNAVDTTSRRYGKGTFTCYRCTDTHAIELFSGSLDECRKWADDKGYDGIVIGSPSLPWAE